MSEYLEATNKILRLENIFLKKKLEMIKSIVENKTVGATKLFLNNIIEDKAKILSVTQIEDLSFVDCSLSTLRNYLARSEFDSYRAGRFYFVNKTFKDLLKK